jgi:hypothetical protein
MGCERLGCPLAGMGTISRQLRTKPVALFGHPAETNLGLASDATPALHQTQCGASENPHRYMQLITQNPRPKHIRSLA